MKRAILNCGQLVTLGGAPGPRKGRKMRELEIIAGGGMLTEGGRIRAIGASADIERLAGDCLITDAGGRVVTPGLVDAHTHFVFGGNRAAEFEMRCEGADYEEIARQGGGILSTVRQTRALSDEALNAQSRQHALWLLQCGTTTAECKSGYSLDIEGELRMLRIIQEIGKTTPLRTVPTLLGLHAVGPEYVGRKDDYVGLVTHEMVPAAAELGVKWCDAFCEGIAFDAVHIRHMAHSAKAHGMELRLHLDQLSDSGGLQFATELGARTADHLEQTSELSIEQAALNSSVQPVVLPGSVYALGKSRYANARAMIDSNMALVLATDFNPGSSPTPSLPMAMSLACTHMHMTPAEALCGCTINAAVSLGLGSEIGSLDVGKSADWCLWDVEDYREIAYWFGATLPSAVAVRGSLVS